MIGDRIYDYMYHGRSHRVRQLAWWTLRRDALEHGSNVRGWHATNIGLHCIAVALVFAILRGFFGPIEAGLGAAVFAAHPLATSSVASISGRFGLLCACFYFAALLCAIIGGWAWFLVPALAYGALASKEEAVSLPFAIAATLITMETAWLWFP